MDHGVSVVGYGTNNILDYYLVKNSYGTNCDDNGHGKCGLLLQGSYPLL